MNILEVTLPIHNIKDFEFKDIDYTYKNYYRITFSFRNKYHNSRTKVGIVKDFKDGCVSLLVGEKVANTLKSNRLNVYAGRDSSGKIYFYSNTAVYVVSNISAIDKKLFELLTEEHNSLPPEFK